MKIMSVADIHLDHNNYKEASSALSEACAMCIRQECDLLALPGDIFNAYNPAGRNLDLVSLLKLFIDPLIKVADAGIQVIVIPGNHDLNAQGKTLLELFKNWHQNIQISLKPETFICFEDRDRSVGFTVSTLPWGFDEIKPGEIAIAHCHLKGIELNGMLIESTRMVDPDIFEPFVYSSIGHIHNNKVGVGNIHYVGGLIQHNFGEEGFNYGYEIFDSVTGEIDRYRPRDIPRYFTIDESMIHLLRTAQDTDRYKIRHRCDYKDLTEFFNRPNIIFEKIIDPVSVKRTEVIYRATDPVLSLLRDYLNEKKLYSDELFEKCKAFLKEIGE